GHAGPARGAGRAGRHRRRPAPPPGPPGRGGRCALSPGEGQPRPALRLPGRALPGDGVARGRTRVVPIA
ncbi:unnamed protein product, partial [Heterosigma akashiwo]